jgi:hypothetical protein
MTAITFFAQNSAEAGAGSWHIAANSFCCFAVAILAFTKGNHDITKPDLIAFVCCLSAMPMWYLTKEPLFAIIIVIIVEGFAYYPTFRKAFFKPREEMASAYTIDSLRAALSVPALQVYSFTTVVYPLFVIFVNLALISMIAVRRQRLVPPLPFD